MRSQLEGSPTSSWLLIVLGAAVCHRLCARWMAVGVPSSRAAPAARMESGATIFSRRFFADRMSQRHHHSGLHTLAIIDSHRGVGGFCEICKRIRLNEPMGTVRPGASSQQSHPLSILAAIPEAKENSQGVRYLQFGTKGFEREMRRATLGTLSANRPLWRRTG